MKPKFIILLLCLIFKESFAQTGIMETSGVIKYQRRIQISDSIFQDLDKYSYFSNSNSNNEEYLLTFDGNISLFERKSKEKTIYDNWIESYKLFTNITNSKRVLVKKGNNTEQCFNDSIPEIRWKLDNELRVIAGYECRKAIGVLTDSIYIVAFYSDNHLFKGGPDGFSGLPGTILGVAVPRFGYYCFAIEISKLNERIIYPNSDCEKMSNNKPNRKIFL